MAPIFPQTIFELSDVQRLPKAVYFKESPITSVSQFSEDEDDLRQLFEMIDTTGRTWDFVNYVEAPGA